MTKFSTLSPKKSIPSSNPLIRKYVDISKYAVLCSLFEILLLAEETVVREQCIKSLHKFLHNASEEVVQKYILPLLYKIYENESFTGKVSACLMIRLVYEKAGKDQDKLKVIYGKLCDDETPLIKKTAAKELGPLCNIFDREYVNADLVAYLKKFMTDQDYVQAIALESLKYLVKLFQNTVQQRINVQIIVAAAEHRSWKIRNEMAIIFPDIVESLGTSINELVSTFAQLIKDAEMEVRLSATSGLTKVIKHVAPDKVISNIVPAIMFLQDESHFEVKTKVGRILGELSNVIGYSLFNSKLRPLYNAYLADANSDVRLGTLESLYEIFRSSEGQMFNNSSTMFSQIQKDTRWRIRSEFIDTLANLGDTFVLF